MCTYDEEKLKKAQRASFLMLEELDRICRAHEISYMLDSGTLLGAVRHQGFIPWDDDIDIAMKREDFERFREAAPGELAGNMKLLLPDELCGGKAFYDFTPRIIYLDSKRGTDAEEAGFYSGELDHLWIDIFILDRISDHRIPGSLTRFLQKIIYGLAMCRRRSVELEKYRGITRLEVALLSWAGHFVSLGTLFWLQKKVSLFFDDRETKHFYYSNYQPDFIHIGVESDWIEKSVMLEFEGKYFPAPAGYDALLRAVYGDYFELPPENQRRPSHSDDIEVF